MSTPKRTRMRGMWKGHWHSANTCKEVPYSGPVSKDENRSAHGNVCVIETCTCGSIRKSNINGMHVEKGEWHYPHRICSSCGKLFTPEYGEFARCQDCVASSIEAAEKAGGTQ